MDDTATSDHKANRLIARLPESGRERLRTMDLPLRFQMELPGKPISHIYFPRTGLASVVSPLPGRVPTEVGIVGREGMTGLPILHGTDRSPFSTFVQIAGVFDRISTEDFMALLRDDSVLRGLLPYSRAFLIQVSETAKANASATIEQRLARWLLMSSDRIENDTVPLTHDFLATMMAVRRAGVTEALHSLAKNAIVAARRGNVQILDRKALEQVAGHFYGVAEKESARIGI